jgi:hypothetical protein
LLTNKLNKNYCGLTFILNLTIKIAAVKGISKLFGQILWKIADLYNNLIYKDKILQK